jgi:hypothetical protein
MLMLLDGDDGLSDSAAWGIGEGRPGTAEAQGGSRNNRGTAASEYGRLIVHLAWKNKILLLQAPAVIRLKALITSREE